MSFGRVGCAVVLCAIFNASIAASGQTATYHLHKEASAVNSSFDKLLTAGPDASSIALTTALAGKAAGEYKIKEFETQTGVPNGSGIIRGGSTLNFSLWMRKTANVGTVFPRARIQLNSASGTLLCTATGSTALTTTVTKQALNCTTSADISMTTTDRYYLWVGVNLTGTSSNTFNGELDLEGTLNGNFDSQITLPLPATIPSISTMLPNAGPVNSSVKLGGSNFGATQGASTVTFNGATALATNWSGTSITATVPPGATTGPVVVTVSGQSSSGVAFTVTPPPAISSLSTSAAVVGTTIIISGTNFGDASGTVTFNGTPAPFASWLDSSIQVTVPAGANTGDVVVTTFGGVSSPGVPFTVVPRAAIFNLQPNSASPGTNVRITGANFGASQGAGSLTFNGASAAISTWTDNAITAVVPIGATSGNLVLTPGASSTASTMAKFPVIDPAAVSVDQVVTGQFSNGSLVTMDPVTTKAAPELLLAFIAAGYGDAVSSVSGGGLSWSLVARSNVQGGSAEVWSAFSTSLLNNVSVTPTLSSGDSLISVTVVTFMGIDPSGAAASIGAVATANSSAGAPSVALTTTRSNSLVFGVASDVSFLGSVASPQPGPDQTLVSQALYEGCFDGLGCSNSFSDILWVQQHSLAIPAAGTSVVLNDLTPSAYAYDAVAVEVLRPAVPPVIPLITSLSSYIGAPGTPITITGVNFGQVTGTVQFNGIAASPTSWSANSIVVSVPQGATTGNVVVNVSGQPSNGISFLVSNSAGLAVDQVLVGNNTATPHFSTTSGNELLLALVSVAPSSFGSQTQLQSSDGNLVWELVQRSNTQQGSAEIWRAFSDGTLTDVQVSGNPFSFGSILTTIVALKGVDASGPNGSAAIGAVGSNNSSAGAPSATLVTTRANSLVFGVGEDPTAAVTRVSGNAQTILAQALNPQPNTLWAQQVTNSIPVSGTTVTLNDTAPSGDAFNLSIVEVRPPAVLPPGINSLTPSTGGGRTPVTISGVNFGDVQGSSTVTFGGIGATISTWSSTAITVPVPDGAPQGADAVVVTVPGAGSSNSAIFTVVPSLTITASLSPLPNPAGWNNTDVTISFTCSGGVAPLQCPAAQVITTEGAQTIHATATDANGSTAGIDVPVNLDKTGPTIAAVVTPTPAPNLVVAAPATIVFSCTDQISGVLTCPAAVQVSTLGAGQVFTGTAIDRAGNSASTSVTLSVQSADLAVTAVASPAPNPAGWNNTDVTISYACSGGVPPLQCPPPQVVSTEGASQVVAGTLQDAAGQIAYAPVTLSIDKTAPAISIVSPADGSNINSSQITLQGILTDALSGVSGVRCGASLGTVTGSAFTCNVPLSSGGNAIAVSAADVAGNSASAGVRVIYTIPIKVQVTSPAALQLFSSSPITLSGNVDNPSATVTVNGVPAQVSNGTFTASGITLREGKNFIAAAATSPDGGVGSDTVTVVLDTTAPTIHIDSPSAGATLTSSQVTVSGTVNDAVSGTVNAEQVSVTVNGVPAQISNRSFSAANVLLVPGLNVITAVARDSAGNSSQHQIDVVASNLAAQQKINIVSGNNQQGAIGTVLGGSLIVQLLDGNGVPLPNRPVSFHVSRSDGLIQAFPTPVRDLTLPSDSSGKASVQFQLGTRVGVGINQVSVTSPGFVGEVVFSEDALIGVPTQVHIVSGELQKGGVGSPLPEPLVVIVNDAGGNPVSGAAVTFNVENGGGILEGASSVVKNTDGDGKAFAVLALGQQEGINNNVVSATIAGAPSVSFISSGVVNGPVSATSISGVVLDNANQPIPNATVSIKGTNVSVITNASGQFTISGADPGNIILFVDGKTSTRPEVFPTLSFQMSVLPGVENSLSGPVFLPAIDADNSKVVGGDQDVILTMKGVEGVAYRVFAHSATFADGSHVGAVSLSQVHADRVPMAPPNGTTPRLMATLQPPGVSFDPPIQVILPNTDGLAPGQVVELFSYRHDLEQFVVDGTARVSDDGSVIVTDPGSGLRQSGWHGGPPPPPPNTTACACDDNDACTTDSCLNGVCQHQNPQPPQQCCSFTTLDPLGIPRPQKGIYTAGLSCCTETAIVPAGVSILDLAAQGNFDNSPKFPTELCPQRVKNLSARIYDGCSIPPFLVWLLDVGNFFGLNNFDGDKDDPLGHGLTVYSFVPTGGNLPPADQSFEFTEVNANGRLLGACDVHDECYQTCSTDPGHKAFCDLELKSIALTLCEPFTAAAAEGKTKACISAANDYYIGVSNGGSSAYEEDQEQYCDCCSVGTAPAPTP